MREPRCGSGEMGVSVLEGGLCGGWLCWLYVCRSIFIFFSRFHIVIQFGKKVVFDKVLYSQREGWDRAPLAVNP